MEIELLARLCNDYWSVFSNDTIASHTSACSGPSLTPACARPSLRFVLMVLQGQSRESSHHRFSYRLRARVLRSASLSWSLTLLVVQSRRRTPVAECARAFVRVFDSASGVTESSKSLHQLCCSAFLRLDRDLPAAFATIELAEIDIRCAIVLSLIHI